VLDVQRIVSDITVPSPNWNGFPPTIKSGLDSLGGHVTALVLLMAGITIASGLLMTLTGAAAGNVVLTSRGRAALLVGVLAGGGLYALVAIAQAVLHLFGG
jgi:hypothetical protein